METVYCRKCNCEHEVPVCETDEDEVFTDDGEDEYFEDSWD
jgi:hypothetical protein